jgi:hypothetical protein
LRMERRSSSVIEARLPRAALRCIAVGASLLAEERAVRLAGAGLLVAAIETGVRAGRGAAPREERGEREGHTR